LAKKINLEPKVWENVKTDGVFSAKKEHIRSWLNETIGDVSYSDELIKKVMPFFSLLFFLSFSASLLKQSIKIKSDLRTNMTTRLCKAIGKHLNVWHPGSTDDNKLVSKQNNNFHENHFFHSVDFSLKNCFACVALLKYFNFAAHQNLGGAQVQGHPGGLPGVVAGRQVPQDQRQ
jgi:hypothetical protein